MIISKFIKIWPLFSSFWLYSLAKPYKKFWPTSTIRTVFLAMASHQKLPRPSFKSYVNNISLCEVCFLKLKFPLAENFLSFSSAPSVRLQCPPYLSNYPTTCGTLISKQCALPLNLFRYSKVLDPIF